VKLFKLNPYIAKEAGLHVLMGTLVNYPLNILFMWLIVGEWGITDPFWISSIVTCWFSIVAFIRIYIVRSYSERRRQIE
jgi:hypothetical protein